MRARKPSSTCFSFLRAGFSGVVFLGGGPTLGRGRPMEEDFRLSVEAAVEVLARLEERTRDCAA